MLNENLRECRNRLGLSQFAVAEKLGIAQVQYGTYERGTRKPSAEILEKLVKALPPAPKESKSRLTLKADLFFVLLKNICS